jgi:hypothetical protein
MKAHLSRHLPVWIAIALILPATAVIRGSDWPDWRGPSRTGVSPETGLPAKWSTAGENLAWQVPYGGRSGPVVFGDHLYLQNTSGSGASEQERVVFPPTRGSCSQTVTTCSPATYTHQLA